MYLSIVPALPNILEERIRQGEGKERKNKHIGTERNDPLILSYF